MKKYVNGYDSPRVEVIKNGQTIVYDFSKKIQSLKEYYEEIGDIITLVDGRKKKYVEYYNYEWVLDHSGWSDAEDLLKYKEIVKANAQGFPIYLTPHKELFYRKFPVHIAMDKTEITTSYDFGGNDNTVNVGFIITFVNAARISEIQTQDADWLPIVSSESCQEF